MKSNILERAHKARLFCKRAFSGERHLTHVIFRHKAHKKAVTNKHGQELKQGTLFVNHTKEGDITLIERDVQNIYDIFLKKCKLIRKFKRRCKKYDLVSTNPVDQIREIQDLLINHPETKRFFKPDEIKLINEKQLVVIYDDSVRMGIRIKIKYQRHGLSYIGAFINHHKVTTLFPEENSKGAPICHDGKPVRKSPLRLK